MNRLKIIKVTGTGYIRENSQDGNMLVEVCFKNKTGDDRFWYPRYSDLGIILSHLIALYGEEEVLGRVLKEGFIQRCKFTLEKMRGGTKH